MGAIQNIIDNIPTLLNQTAERADELLIKMTEEMKDGDGHECTMDSIYVLLRGYEVLNQGNNTDDENEKAADKLLLEKVVDLPGNPIAGSPSFVLNLS